MHEACFRKFVCDAAPSLQASPSSSSANSSIDYPNMGPVHTALGPPTYSASSAERQAAAAAGRAGSCQGVAAGAAIATAAGPVWSEGSGAATGDCWGGAGEFEAPQQQGVELVAPVKAESSNNNDLDSEYEEDDLDSDWKALLADVDGRLTARGASCMDAKERAIAIKKLLVATGSRGVDFAMGATLEEVLRFRKFHGQRN